MFVPHIYAGILEHRQDRPPPWPQARWVRARPGNKELLPPDLFVLVEAGFGSTMLDPSS